MVASYFDVDGTLTRTNLVQPLVFYMLNQQNPLRALSRVTRAALSAPALFASEQVDRGTFNELLFRGYAGMSEDRLLELAAASRSAGAAGGSRTGRRRWQPIHSSFQSYLPWECAPGDRTTRG